MKGRLLSRYAAMLVALLLINLNSDAQIWKSPMANSNTNFYTIQNAFNHDMRSTLRKIEREQTKGGNSVSSSKKTTNNEESEEEMEGYLQFKRWEHFMEPRVFPSGDLSLPSSTWNYFQTYLNNTPAAMQMYLQGNGNPSVQHSINPNTIQSSSWTFAGPTGSPIGSGAGRIGFVRLDPTNANTIWVGAPAGGLWKSTNGGASWTTNTDFLTVIGVSDVVIDSTNTQIMYLATGDGDHSDTYSTGVLKSIDGGATWNPSGLAWTVTQGRTIRKLLIMPGTPSTIMAFSNVGIWRTTNSGATWTQVLTTSCFDAEFMPQTPNTIYACGKDFFKSTNGGATWTTITTGLPTAASVNRLAIAVTAASSATIYLVAGSAANSGLYGFYKSTNSGTSFTQITIASPSNLLGWSNAGSDVGGQSWYDLTIDCSPTNANEVCVGGVNLWRTTNGGTNWTLNGHWTGSGAPYVHADQHAMLYLNATTMLIGCDGGVFKTTNNGGAWADLSNNLCIAQMYRIGLSGQTGSPNLWLTGHQDNGTNLKNGATYARTLGGDGMDCFIDRTNNSVMYGSYQVGGLNRSTNGGANWNSITSGLTGNAPWVTPWYQDPTAANTIYCGRSDLWKSTNQGTNWTMLTALPSSTHTGVVDFKVAPSSNQTIYLLRPNAAYLTTDGGVTWTTITGTLPVGSAFLSRVDVKPSDPLTAIVTLSGYSSGNKAFKTTNGGTTWTNISTGLPNLPCNALRYDPSSTIGAVYIGSDVGVYYLDSSFLSWQPYFTSLPNVPIFDLEIHAGTAKLRAASFGRGVWEVDIFNPGTLPPIAQFSANTFITCSNTPINFTDQTSYNPTAWNWTFPNATPSTSTAQNPSGISWATAGTYTVTLTSSNANGTSSTTQVITIKPLPTVTTTTTSGTICAGNSTSITASGAVSYNWMPGNLSGATITISPATTTTYTVTGTGANGCTNTAIRTITVNPIPTVTTTTTSGTICAGNSTSITASGASSYNWMPGNLSGATITVSPLTTTTYTVTGNTAGCTNTATRTITVNPAPIITTTTTAATICVGNSSSITATGGATYMWMPGNLSGATITISPAATTTYTVTGTGANGCTNTATRTITVNPTPIITITTTLATVCSGNNTSLTASGATSYVWMPGNLSGATIIVSPTTTTTYTATGTNGNGCVGSAIITITTIANPTILATTTMNTICAGGTTTITASGANSYSWMPGNLSGTTVTVSPLSTTTYTVIGTATNGCTNTTTQTITVSAAPNVTIFTPSFLMCSTANATLTASGATSYTWQPGNLSGATITVSPLSTTTYTVVGTNGNGCTNSATQMIVVSPSPTVVVTATNSSICYGDSVTLVVSGASVYNWMPGNLSNATVTYVPATSTTYTVIGTYPSGCSDTLLVPITVNIIPTVTASISADSVCIGNSITLTGFGAATYSWQPINMSGSPITDFPISSTTYTVTGLSAAGCSNTSTVSVFVNSIPLVNAVASSNLICLGASVNLNGTGAASYLWQPINLSGPTVSDAPTTTVTYTVTGTDLNGCINIDSTTVTVVFQPTVSIAGLNIICPGNSVSLTASGATSYAWLPGGQTTATIIDSPITSTTYSVTGTDSLGCFSLATHTVVIDIPPATPIVIVNGNVLTSNVIGANYQWFLNGVPIPLSTGQSCTATVLGTYTVEVYDSLGCGSGQSAAVVDPTGIAQLNDFDFMRVIPNPNDGHFMLSIHATKTDNYILEIQNMLGQIVYREILNNLGGNYNHEINLTNYGVGVYTIRLINSEKEQIIKSVTY